MTKTKISTRPLAPSDWSTIAQLFGTSGACGGCWCMYWRVPSTGKYWQEHKGAKNRRAFKALVESGKANGVLAFDGERPIGWCSVGPREDFAYFARARKIPPAKTARTWSVTCFFVNRAARRSGVATRLLASAIELARTHRADYIEGYPVDTSAAAKRQADAFVYTGVPSLFVRAGFERTADAGARAVYGRKL